MLVGGLDTRMHVAHPDLAPNVDPAREGWAAPPDAAFAHATAVSGVC